MTFRPPLALAAVLLIAAAAGGAGPLSAAPRAEMSRYLSAQEIATARAYRAPRYRIAVAGELLRLAGLFGLFLAARPLVKRAQRGARAMARRERWREPLIVCAMAAAYEAVLFLAGLPGGLALYRADRAAGLVHQPLGGWFADAGIAAALDVAAAVPLAFIVLLLVRRVRRWWIPAAAAVSALLVVTMFVWPLLIEPVFNRFTPLGEGAVRQEATALLERAGLRAGPMLVMDASRRESRSNAYVSGLGKTQRVVLYDTLLRDFPPPEVAAVLAHEIGHRAHRDTLRGTALSIPAIFAAFAASAWILRRMRSARGPATGPEFLPALAFVLFALTAVSGPAANAVSRWMEAGADTYALDLVADPRAVLDAELRLARTNLIDPAPPEWARWLFFDHPSLPERVAAAEARVNAAPAPREGP